PQPGRRDLARPRGRRKAWSAATERWTMGSMTATEERPPLPAGPLSVADLEAFPDDGHRYELIDGVLVVTPAPVPLHQRAVLRLAMILEEATPPGHELFVAPLAVHPESGPPST